MTLTKEWLLKTIAELEEERDATPGAVNEDVTMALAAMKLALASLEARSRKLFTCSACGAEGLDEPLESKCHCNEDGAHWIESVVYTAPPAPVSDSLLSELLGIAKRAAAEADECAHAEFSDDSMKQSAAIADWERRAAMLRGADGNSPVIPDVYVLVPVEPTEEMIAAAMCSNDVLFDKEDDTLFRVQHGEIWRAMLSTAPQQEVTQALAKGMERYGDAMQELAKKEVK
ncbi:TPA: hypothetical protein ACTYN4_002959 [Enterobacter hormaechei]